MGRAEKMCIRDRVAPEQVHMEALRPQDGHSLGRMDAYGKTGAYAGISWYASYPCQLAGDPSEATVQKGELCLLYTSRCV